MKLNVKISLLGVGSVLVTAMALVALAVWQSGLYNLLSQNEVNELIDADLNHIAQGIYNLVQTENEAVQQHLHNNLNVAHHVLANAGEIRFSPESIPWHAVNQITGESQDIQLLKMCIGDRELGQNHDPAVETPIVDEIIQLVGGTATLFQRMNDQGDMIRIATTIQTNDGQRAIGTYIPARDRNGSSNPVIASILKGDPYHGRAYVVNEWYLTAYEPIQTKSGNLVGMLYVGVQQKTVEARIRQAILNTKVGKTGYVYILGGKGEHRGQYIISHRGERDGENIWETQDSDGRYVIQAIIDKVLALQSGELTSERYRWQNPGESEPRWKIARLVYYEPWDWIIGASVHEEELLTYQTVLNEGRIRMTRIMIQAGFAISLLIGVSSILVSLTLVRPIRQMTRAAETIIQGNLNQRVDIQSKDEIGILAQTFNTMTLRLSQTLRELRESEEKYRRIFENAVEGLFQSTMEGRFLRANPTLARILGYDSPDELIAKVTDIRQQLYVNPSNRDEIISVLLQNGFVQGQEIQFYCKDKTIIWISISARLVYNDLNQPDLIEGFINDISISRQAQDALKEQLFFTKQFLDAIPTPVFFKNTQGMYLDCNHAFEELLGRTKEEILGNTVKEIAPHDRIDIHKHVDDLLFQHPGKQTYETDIVSKNGIYHDVIFYKATFLGMDHRVAGLVAVILEITERKQAEEALKKSEREFRQLIENSPVAMLITIGENEENLLINKKFTELFGYTLEDIPNVDHWWPLAYPDEEYREANRKEWKERVVWALKNQDEIAPMEVRIRCKNGSIRYIDIYLSSIGEKSLVTFVDLTERKRAEKELQIVHQRLEDIIEFLPDATFVIDSQKKVIAWNRALEEMTGVRKEEIVGQGDFAYAIPFFGKRRPIVIDLIGTKDPATEALYDFVERHGNTLHTEIFVPSLYGGQGAYVSVMASPLLDHEGHRYGAIESIRDITERKKLEEQLLQSQKMDAIGKLAGGIAHDFNNLLTVITGYSDLALHKLSSNDPLHRTLDEILKAGNRATALTRQLLAYSRKQVMQPRILNINELVINMDNMLRRLIGEDIDLIILPQNDLRFVKADPSQIEQVIMNLALNARDAMPKGGRLTIETNNVDFGDTVFHKSNKVLQGSYVLLAFSDNGSGMDKETLNQIFDPFFTTKEKGKGTGLGLPTVYGIVKQSGGHLFVYSEVGKGTTFKIYLPICEETIQDGMPQNMKSRKGTNESLYGTETILVVEDEEMVRNMVSHILKEYKYTVLQAGNGDEAFAISGQYPGTIDLLLSDVVLPGKNGREVTERLKQSRPDMKVLFMSGYTEKAIVHHGIVDDGIVFIQKPFSPESLARKVREILDAVPAKGR